MAAATHLEAQIPTSASPFVSPEHWSYEVLRRLDHAGMLPAGADLARQSIPQEEIGALLAAAAQHGRAAAYLQRFRREFSEPNGAAVLDASVSAGWRATDGLVAPGIGYDSANWSGARPIDDESDADVRARTAFALSSWLAGAIEQRSDNLNEAQLVAASSFAGIWAGRRELGYGLGNGGGLVVDANRFDGAGIFLARPLRIPLLGATRFEMHVAKIDNVLNLNNQQNEIEPWFWTARGSFEPVADLRVGINRGMMFGGEGNLPVTFSRVAENIIGIYTDDGESSFANQVISVDFRYRLPAIPVTAYLDWGSDDAAGGWWDVPALLGGLEIVHVDSAFDVAVGVEHLQFSATCCGNSIWYRNGWFRGSWADGDELLGHPLGGHGREWRVFANGGFGERLLASGTLYTRRRRAENVFAPERAGKSTGAQLSLDVSLSEKLRLLVEGEGEWGDADWSASRFGGGLRYRF